MKKKNSGARWAVTLTPRGHPDPPDTRRVFFHFKPTLILYMYLFCTYVTPQLSQRQRRVKSFAEALTTNNRLRELYLFGNSSGKFQPPSCIRNHSGILSPKDMRRWPALCAMIRASWALLTQTIHLRDSALMCILRCLKISGLFCESMKRTIQAKLHASRSSRRI